MDETKIKRLHQAYKNFSGDMSNEWEEFSYLDFCIRNSSTSAFTMNSLSSHNICEKTKSDAGGMQVRFLRGGNSKNHFINAIGLFETYISKLVQTVFIDFPQKMHCNDMPEQKLFDLIIKNETKESLIENLSEEKVRSIFYGNPTEIFIKDRCKLELGDTFTNKYPEAIKLYSEIVGRRNAIIHNSGRVDQKYLRENKNTAFNAGDKIIISEDYLRGTIILLIGIAAKTTECTVKKIYKGDVQGIIKRRAEAFERLYDDGWYTKLLS